MFFIARNLNEALNICFCFSLDILTNLVECAPEKLDTFECNSTRLARTDCAKFLRV